MALPRDIGLRKDDFQKSLIFNETDSLINYILNILLMRPGNLPSMPEIGVNIGQYITPNMKNEIDPDFLKGLISSNCQDILPYLSEDEIIIGVLNDEEGRDILMIKIPLYMEQPSKIQQEVYYIFYRNTLNALEFNFLVDTDI